MSITNTAEYHPHTDSHSFSNVVTLQVQCDARLNASPIDDIAQHTKLEE